jgi:hypothetical protein
MGNKRDLEVKIEVREESRNPIFALDDMRRETLFISDHLYLTF